MSIKTPHTSKTTNNNYIIFYSQRCNESIFLLKLLQNENLINYFRLICVDGIINKIPPQIKVVPTIIVAGINRPLASKEAFEWVNKMKFLKQSTSNTSSSTSSTSMIQNANKKESEMFPSFNVKEM